MGYDGLNPYGSIAGLGALVEGCCCHPPRGALRWAAPAPVEGPLICAGTAAVDVDEVVAGVTAVAVGETESACARGLPFIAGGCCGVCEVVVGGAGAGAVAVEGVVPVNYL